MNEIVYKSQDGTQPLTNSVLVAEKFEKRHDVVTTKIKSLLKDCPQKCGQFFSPTIYVDNSGKENPMYIMNRDGFTLLAMGFTGAKALQFKLDYIEAFNKMEKATSTNILLSQDNGAIKMLADSMAVMSAQINQMQSQLNKQMLLVNKKEAVVKKDKRIRPRQYPYHTAAEIAEANDYTLSEFNKKLENLGIQQWNESKSRWELKRQYDGKSYTYVVVYDPLEYGDEPREYLVWTNCGIKFIYNMIDDNPF